jgi:PKHD-type hydroxylase|tara:strand:+ start:892 stop:1461 length:570 start_codon:yes stop_codon:yes gene_type:complete
MLWPFKVDTVETHCAIENFLSDEECKSVIELGLSQNIQKGVTFNGENDPTRESNIAWIHATERRADWLFRRITDAGIYVNKTQFHFDLMGLGEGLQFTHYTAPGGKYGVHTDSGPGACIRKLSFVIQLSNSTDYEGGDLTLHLSDDPLVIPKKKGTICFFPSYVLHEVTKVTKGQRFSVVGWITGPQFK